MAYNKFKDLEKRTQPDIVLKNKALKVASNPKYNGYERGSASMVYNFFDKNLKEVVQKTSNYLMNFINQLLESLKKEKCVFLLSIIFKVLI